MGNAKILTWSIGVTLAALLAACGGGGSGSTGGSASAMSAADPGAVSSGAITAFGSVFVNGHEFSTAGARLVDDDTGTESTSTAGLEVGMVVDVLAAPSSSASAPVASELHLHPLARGYVDATDLTKSTLTVMGQIVQASASTNFSDHRACVRATTSPCTAITGLSGLVATAVSGATATAGSYVTVHGYLFGATGPTPASANIVATLISVADAPAASASGAAFKVEGVVAAPGTSSITIGGLTIDLSKATCYAAGKTASCTGAFSAGQVVSAFGATAPALPASSFTADFARSRSSLLVTSAGATVEIEGSVSSVTSTSPAGFVVRGITIDASALPASTGLPAVGDIVSVLGTVGTGGTSITATSVKVLRHSQSTTYGFEGDVSAISSPAANTFVANVLGQTVTVNATSRLMDVSTHDWDLIDPATNPFNITTFQTYLAASSSKHVLVQAYVDASGNLNVISLTIVPASTVDAVSGRVDATPAPTNSTSTGTPSTFSIHGVAVSADPASIRAGHAGAAAATIASGDEVTVFGTGSTTGSALTVGATPSRTNFVIDFGVPQSGRGDGF